jgi:hypothetical protein
VVLTFFASQFFFRRFALVTMIAGIVLFSLVVIGVVLLVSRLRDESLGGAS